MRKYVKFIALLCVGAIFVVSLSGCGKLAKKNEKKEEKEINLTFSFWEPGTGKAMENSLKKIIEDYEASHENVNIKLLVKANSGYSQWITTQMSVDALPDIQSNHAGELKQQYNQGYIYNLADDLKKPNPYNNNKIWEDTFKEGTLDNNVDKYAMPYFGTEIAIFYNKTMYDKLGLNVPKTWNEFIKNCKKIEANDSIPIAFMAQKNDAVDWLCWNLTMGTVGKKLLSDPHINFDGDVRIADAEIVRSIKEGYLDYTANTELQDLYKTYIKYFKEYLKYSPNARSYDESAAKTLFMSGKAAHIMTGSWDIEGLIYDEEIPFEVGTFPFPKFTEENCQYGGLPLSLGNVQTLGLSSKLAKDEAKREAAIDFLMYFTSPDAYAKFVNGAKQIPVIKGAAYDEAFDGFIRPGYKAIYFYKLGTEDGLRFSKIERKLIEGENFNPTDEDFKQIQISIEAWAQSLIENNKAMTAETNWGTDNVVPSDKYTGEEYKD